MKKRKQGMEVKVTKKKQVLSNGMDSTLENWREFARLGFGDKSAAITYIDHLIERDGPEHKVRDTEASMKLMLATIHDHPDLIENLGK